MKDNGKGFENEMSIEVKRIIVGIVRTNCYIVYNDKKETLIIDPADQADRIIQFISENELKPMAILLTHGHFDHIGAVTKLKEEYGAKVYAHKDEKDVLNIQDINLSSKFYMNISIDADMYLEDGTEFNVGDFSIRLIHTPGHTKGSCCYLIDDMLFSGDTLFNATHGRTDFPTGSESRIIRSIKEKLLVLDGNTHVFPGHDADTTIEEEKRYY